MWLFLLMKHIEPFCRSVSKIFGDFLSTMTTSIWLWKSNEDSVQTIEATCHALTNCKEKTNCSHTVNSCPCVVTKLLPTQSMGSSIMLKLIAIHQWSRRSKTCNIFWQNIFQTELVLGAYTFKSSHLYSPSYSIIN